MRILLVSYVGSNSGAGVSTFELASVLKREGHEVVVVSTEKYPGIETYRIRDFRVVPMFFVRDWYLRYFLGQILKKHDFDVIHSSEVRFIAKPVIEIARRFNVPSVVHYRSYWFSCLRGDYLMNGKSRCSGTSVGKCLKCRGVRFFLWELYKVQYFLRRKKILLQADFNIAISDKIGDGVKKYLSEINTRVIYNSVSSDYSHLSDSSEKVIGFVGELASHKGIKEFMEFAKEMAKVNNEIKFLIIGDGELYSESKRFVEDCGLGERVRFLGKVKREEMFANYNRMSILYFPYLWDEPFGRVIVEAMSGGKVVFCSRRGASDELIRDGESGFLINPGDIEKNVELVSEILNDKKRMLEISKNARKRAEYFSQERLYKEVMRVYKSLIKK